MTKIRTLFASTRVRVIAGALALLAVGGVFGAVLATALPAHASANATNGANTTTPGTPTTGVYCQLYEQTLATNLGVSANKLESANISSIDTVIDQMVKDGKLTQTQATQIKTKVAANGTNVCAHLPGLLHNLKGHGRGGALGGALMTLRTAVQQAVATELNLTTTQLQSDLQTTDIVSLAKTKNITQAALNTTITNTVKAQLDGLVKAGTVTSATETRALSMLSAQLTAGHYGLFGLGKMGGK